MTVLLQSNPPWKKLSMRLGWEQYRRTTERTVLEGRTIELDAPGAGALRLDFVNGELSWVVEGEFAGSGHGPFDLTEMRSGIFFIDVADILQERSLSVVLDDNTGSAMIVHHILESRGGVLNMMNASMPARVKGSDAPLYKQSDELMGKRAFVYYQDDHAIEHIYLNRSLIAYQMIAGGAEGLATGAALAATTWKIAENLFLLTFVETRPESVNILMDYDAKRNVGKLFLRDDFGLINMPCGARIGDFGTDLEYAPEFLADPKIASEK